jgi:hypothetical protein
LQVRRWDPRLADRVAEQRLDAFHHHAVRRPTAVQAVIGAARAPRFAERRRARYQRAEDAELANAIPLAEARLGCPLLYEHRAALFSSPLMFGALDGRFAKDVPVRPGDAAVVGKVDLARRYGNP